jgi:hypothetical protein
MPIQSRAALPVLPSVSEGFPVLWANYTVVQSSGSDVVISFFQALAPIVEDQEAHDRLEHIKGNCVARIVLNPFSAAQFTNGLQDVLTAFFAAVNAPPQAPKEE